MVQIKLFKLMSHYFRVNINIIEDEYGEWRYNSKCRKQCIK